MKLWSYLSAVASLSTLVTATLNFNIPDRLSVPTLPPLSELVKGFQNLTVQERKVFEYAKLSAVKLYTEWHDGNNLNEPKLGTIGTGFVVHSMAGKRSLILTNRHVIDPAFSRSNFSTGTKYRLKNPTLKTASGHLYGFQLLERSMNDDLALLISDADFGDFKYKWRDPKTLRRGETCYLFGYPAGRPMGVRGSYLEMESTNNTGIAKSELRLKGISPIGGASGSAVYDSYSKLVGIYWGYSLVKTQDTWGVAEPSYEAVAFVDGYLSCANEEECRQKDATEKWKLGEIKESKLNLNM